jgi:hypothetical protein
MNKAICPECKEYANHEYGNVYSCPVCGRSWKWRHTLVERRNGKFIYKWKYELINTLPQQGDPA